MMDQHVAWNKDQVRHTDTDKTREKADNESFGIKYFGNISF